MNKIFGQAVLALLIVMAGIIVASCSKPHPYTTEVDCDGQTNYMPPNDFTVYYHQGTKAEVEELCAGFPGDLQGCYQQVSPTEFIVYVDKTRWDSHGTKYVLVHEAMHPICGPKHK